MSRGVAPIASTAWPLSQTIHDNWLDYLLWGRLRRGALGVRSAAWSRSSGWNRISAQLGPSSKP